ncbi:hypothetical protein ACHAW5_009799, partial [Stephanodiscus triporus]
TRQRQRHGSDSDSDSDSNSDNDNDSNSDRQRQRQRHATQQRSDTNDSSSNSDSDSDRQRQRGDNDSDPTTATATTTTDESNDNDNDSDSDATATMRAAPATDSDESDSDTRQRHGNDSDSDNDSDSEPQRWRPQRWGVSGRILGGVSHLKTTKNMTRRTTAGIMFPLQPLRVRGAADRHIFNWQHRRLSGHGTYARAPPEAVRDLNPWPIMGRSGGLPSAPPPPFVPQPQGGAQIAVQPPATQGGTGTGRAHTPAGAGPINTHPQEYSGIASVLERLAPLLTDADTARNLRWQRDVDGDKKKLAIWKMEATGSSGLQFYAYMQPGAEAAAEARGGNTPCPSSGMTGSPCHTGGMGGGYT